MSDFCFPKRGGGGVGFSRQLGAATHEGLFSRTVPVPIPEFLSTQLSPSVRSCGIRTLYRSERRLRQSRLLPARLSLAMRLLAAAAEPDTAMTPVCYGRQPLP